MPLNMPWVWCPCHSPQTDTVAGTCVMGVVLKQYIGLQVAKSRSIKLQANDVCLIHRPVHQNAAACNRRKLQQCVQFVRASQLVQHCRGLVECLQAINETGRDQGLKSVYSNAMDATQIKDLKHYATSKMAFKHVAAKETASVHVKDLDLNTSLVIAFNRSGYAACCWLP